MIDTTARGFFRSARDQKALRADLALALEKIELRLTDVAPAKLTTPWGVYVLDIKGLG